MVDTNKQTSTFGGAFSFLSALCPDRNQAEESKHAEANRPGLGTAILAQATTELDFAETDGCMWYKEGRESPEPPSASLLRENHRAKALTGLDTAILVNF